MKHDTLSAFDPDSASERYKKRTELEGMEERCKDIEFPIEKMMWNSIRARFAYAKEHGTYFKSGIPSGEQDLGISIHELDDKNKDISETVERDTPNVRFFVTTNTGGPESKYAKNQDAFFFRISKDRGGDEKVTIAVFDGVGGLDNGRLAAAAACVGLQEGLLPDMYETLETKYHAILKAVKKYAMGGDATGVVLHYRDSGGEFRYRTVEILAAGDCKALTIRKGSVLKEGTTVLENKAQVAITSGSTIYDPETNGQKKVEPKDLYTLPMANRLTGSFSNFKEDSQKIKFDAESGDIVILASDALWSNVSEYEIIELMKEAGADLGKKLYQLVYERNNSGGDSFDIQHDAATTVKKTLVRGDNITIAVVEIK